MSKKTIKMGIFGGYRGSYFYKCVLANNAEIVAVCDRPLVLHGGSGTPNDQMQNAIRHGITKINIYSDVLYALNKGLKDTLNSVTNPSAWPFIVYEESKKMMKEVVREKLHTFGSAGRL